MSALPRMQEPLCPDALDALAFGAPFLAIDLEVVAQAYAAIRRALPQVTVHYAVKCNPEPAILARLDALGSGFEIASLAELRLLAALGVDLRDVLYSNPVKPSEHIAGAWRLGVERFAADSRCELEKLAAHAPGARVYVRLDASDPTSRVPLAGKFGIDPVTAVALLVEARSLGLVPHGLTFHVGSQALDPGTWQLVQIDLVGAVQVCSSPTRPGLSCSISEEDCRPATPSRCRPCGRTSERSPTRWSGCRTRSRSSRSPDGRSWRRPVCSRPP